MKNIKMTNDRNQLLASWASVPIVTRSDPDSQWFPALDITKTAEDYLIEVDVPGLNPADIEVTADGEPCRARLRLKSSNWWHKRSRRII